SSIRTALAVLVLAAAGGCAEPTDWPELDDEADALAPRVALAPSSACPPSSGALVWPISGQATAVQATDVIQDVYGAIIRGGLDYDHGGVDFRAPTGTPIHAVADGFVTRKCAVGQAGCSGHAGKGNWLLVQHFDPGPNEETLYTVYAHMSSFDTDGFGTELVEGDCVAAGDALGRVGSTGTANTEHLHLSLHADLGSSRSPVNGNSRNPWQVLPDKVGTVGYVVTAPGPDANGDLQLHVEVEAQFANIARIEAFRLEEVTCIRAPCNPIEIDQRTLTWDGAGVMSCGPSCPDVDISPVDFDPGDYQSPYDPQDPADPGDPDHVWDFFITPANAIAGDERYRIFDVHDRLVAEGPLD
ncbi:MAG: M23 family metallopeptidase, partial [Myxococcales bacterium]|nr:M23 family metallopeptidase [Myxococcales bacterium]